MPISEKDASKLEDTASKVGSEFQQPFDEDRLHLFVQRPGEIQRLIVPV